VRIVQVSDTHLTNQGGVTNENFERVVDYVNGELRPDLVVSSGDVALLDPDDQFDRAAAHRLHQFFDAPLFVLPGNHDVGEPGSDPWMGLRVTDERVAAFRATFGSDRFSTVAEDWTVLGIDSELLGSGLSAETEQWRWLSDELAVADGGPVLLFTHKPLWWPLPEPDEEPVRDLAADVEASERLRALFAPGQLRAVASGHLHRYALRPREDLLEIWAPSTAFVAGTGERPLPQGLEHLGVVALDCGPGTVEARFVEVPGLEERVVTDVPQAVATRDRLEARAG
jgi:3',5'-cyclic AMP phosphodiesterase CpdA